MAQRNKVRIYSIILTNHGKQLKTICSEPTEKKINDRLQKLLKENEKVIFPMMFNNHEHVMVDADYELVVIKCKQFGDSNVNKIKDRNGQYINYESNDEDWIVVDRVAYNIEETFWVYGYHPRLQRKTFKWVFDNFVAVGAKDKYKFKTIQIYHNKVIFECNGHLEMVLCKNKSDSIRFYNLLEQWCLEKKYKYVAFMGDISKSKFREEWVDRLMKWTNWNKQKIIRQSTRD